MAVPPSSLPGLGRDTPITTTASSAGAAAISPAGKLAPAFSQGPRKVLVKPIAPKQGAPASPPGYTPILGGPPSGSLPLPLQQALMGLTTRQQQALLASVRSLAQPAAPSMAGGASSGPTPSMVGPMASTGVKPTSNMPPPVSDPSSARRPRSFGHMHSSAPEHQMVSSPPLLEHVSKVVTAPITMPPLPAPSQMISSSSSSATNKPRKPCNCKNSQCLKLYCDCFANGEFCRDNCNCQKCKNSLQFEHERAKAVKSCLDRNPNAFKPKVGTASLGDGRRHIKGCNCRKSSCLKNYCECYEAKIPCSSLCRCVGCQNLQDRPEGKSLMQLADAADIRTRQQKAASSHFLEQLETTHVRSQPVHITGHRFPYAFVNKEVAKATCLCLLEEASHAAMTGNSPVQVERAVLVEFGRCLQQIITAAESANRVVGGNEA